VKRARARGLRRAALRLALTIFGLRLVEVGPITETPASCIDFLDRVLLIEDNTVMRSKATVSPILVVICLRLTGVTRKKLSRVHMGFVALVVMSFVLSCSARSTLSTEQENKLLLRDLKQPGLLDETPSVAQEQTPTVAGPMLGHVTAETATVWMFVPAGSKAELSYGMEGDDAKKMVAAFEPIADPAVPAQEAGGMPVIAKLDGLQPETAYGYSIQVGGKSSPLWAGTFRSAAPTGKPGKFRVALTSCMKIDQPQASWFLLLAQQPDLHLAVGDTQYSDTTQPKIQWQHHLRYRREKEFATVLRQIPTYSLWDDHDYGPNNSDGTAKGKENSLHGWKQIWANPAAGTAEVPGAFYEFSRGEVDFFVVDGRYHRSPDKAPDDEKKRMLGDAQFNWLIEGLKSSKAKFKVIASGSTLQESESDGWRIYTFARHRLLDAIKAESISGVMYFSGDVHLSLVRQHHESDRVGYPLIEVISSGIANSKTLSFATIDFDTASKDPSVRVRIIHGDGTVRDDKSWSLSQLGGP